MTFKCHVDVSVLMFYNTLCRVLMFSSNRAFSLLQETHHRYTAWGLYLYI